MLACRRKCGAVPRVWAHRSHHSSPTAPSHHPHLVPRNDIALERAPTGVPTSLEARTAMPCGVPHTQRGRPALPDKQLWCARNDRDRNCNTDATNTARRLRPRVAEPPLSTWLRCGAR